MTNLEDFGDPQQTVRLLDYLSGVGLKNAHIQRLHHFGDRETIASHLAYCMKQADQGSTFESQGTNRMVQRRLAIVESILVAGRFGTEALDNAVDAALLMMPKR